MTIISALMRNIGQNTSLTSLSTLRTLMAITGLAPVPSDAIVTPVTFRARKRNLRGILAEHDAKEDGTRILSAEWIVGKRLWLRLQDEWRRVKAEGRTGRRPRHKKERVILFLHGGAYYMFSVATHRTVTIPLSKYTDARVFALDYRLAPETRFPGQLHDAVLAYLRLVEDLHIPPENIVVCGDSAGGGLAMSLLLYLRDEKYPLPSAAILMSPWVGKYISLLVPIRTDLVQK
jgi:acetyl esterase/lipase